MSSVGAMYLPVLQYGSESAGITPDHPDEVMEEVLPDADQQHGDAAAQGNSPVKQSSTRHAADSEDRARPDLPPSLTEARSRAVYDRMERLLELSTETEQQLLAAVQHLSGEEFLQVAEERALAGMCGSAACANLLSAPKPKGTFKIDTRQQRIYRDGDIMFCSTACDLRAQRMAARLGTVDAALERFAAALPQPPKTPAASQTKQRSVYAAGAEGSPIMMAEVKEVDPSVLRAREDAQAAAAQLSAAALAAGYNPGAVEGYVPRSGRKGAPSAAPGSIVSVTASAATSDEEGSGAGVSTGQSAPAPALAVQPDASTHQACDAAPPALSAAPEDAPIAVEEAAGQTRAEPPISAPQQPVLVFEVDDPQSPLEVADGGDAAGMASRFGQLRVTDASELSLGAQQLQHLSSQQQQEAPAPGIDADLQLWRSHLASEGRDPAAAGDMTLDPSAPEDAGQSGAAEEGEPQDALDGGACPWLEDAPGGPQQLSRFGAMFTLLDGMATEAALAYLRSSNSQPAEAPAPVARRAPLEAAIARSLHAVLAGMRVAALRSVVEQHLRALIATFSIHSALPSLREHEWQLVTLVLLKALSLQRLPALQPNLEGRVGVQSINDYLNMLGFSLEEFQALLEAVLPA